MLTFDSKIGKLEQKTKENESKVKEIEQRIRELELGQEELDQRLMIIGTENLILKSQILENNYRI